MDEVATRLSAVDLAAPVSDPDAAVEKARKKAAKKAQQKARKEKERAEKAEEAEKKQREAIHRNNIRELGKKLGTTVVASYVHGSLPAFLLHTELAVEEGYSVSLQFDTVGKVFKLAHMAVLEAKSPQKGEWGGNCVFFTYKLWREWIENLERKALLDSVNLKPDIFSSTDHRRRVNHCTFGATSTIDEEDPAEGPRKLDTLIHDAGRQLAVPLYYRSFDGSENTCNTKQGSKTLRIHRPDLHKDGTRSVQVDIGSGATHLFTGSPKTTYGHIVQMYFDELFRCWNKIDKNDTCSLLYYRGSSLSRPLVKVIVHKISTEFDVTVKWKPDTKGHAQIMAKLKKKPTGADLVEGISWRFYCEKTGSSITWEDYLILALTDTSSSQDMIPKSEIDRIVEQIGLLKLYVDELQPGTDTETTTVRS